MLGHAHEPPRVRGLVCGKFFQGRGRHAARTHANEAAHHVFINLHSSASTCPTCTRSPTRRSTTSSAPARASRAPRSPRSTWSTALARDVHGVACVFSRTRARVARALADARQRLHLPPSLASPGTARLRRPQQPQGDRLRERRLPRAAHVGPLRAPTTWRRQLRGRRARCSTASASCCARCRRTASSRSSARTSSCRRSTRRAAALRGREAGRNDRAALGLLNTLRRRRRPEGRGRARPRARPAAPRPGRRGGRRGRGRVAPPPVVAEAFRGGARRDAAARARDRGLGAADNARPTPRRGDDAGAGERRGWSEVAEPVLFLQIDIPPMPLFKDSRALIIRRSAHRRAHQERREVHRLVRAGTSCASGTPRSCRASSCSTSTASRRTTSTSRRTRRSSTTSRTRADHRARPRASADEDAGDQARPHRQHLPRLAARPGQGRPEEPARGRLYRVHVQHKATSSGARSGHRCRACRSSAGRPSRTFTSGRPAARAAADAAAELRAELDEDDPRGNGGAARASAAPRCLPYRPSIHKLLKSSRSDPPAPLRLRRLMPRGFAVRGVATSSSWFWRRRRQSATTKRTRVARSRRRRCAPFSKARWGSTSAARSRSSSSRARSGRTRSEASSARPRRSTATWSSSSTAIVIRFLVIPTHRLEEGAPIARASRSPRA